MQQGVREVAICHGQAVVDSPQRRAETRTDPGEPAARRCVRLEHDERLARLLRDIGRVQVDADDVFARGVV